MSGARGGGGGDRASTQLQRSENLKNGQGVQKRRSEKD